MAGLLGAGTVLPAFGQMGIHITTPKPKNKHNTNTMGIGLTPNDNQTPIGGMAVLAVLGAGYAIKKLSDSREL